MAVDRKSHGIDGGFGRTVELREMCNTQFARNLMRQLCRELLAAKRQVIHGKMLGCFINDGA